MKREILNLLKECEPYALPQGTLLIQITARLRPHPTEAQIVTCLAELKAQQFIDSIEDALEGKPKWLITEAGLAQLKK